MNRKLLVFLRILSKSELVGFSHYLDSPLFNTNKKFVLLWEGLIEYAPEFLLEEKDWEHIFHMMWPKREFNKAELRTKVSRLLILMKSYLCLLEIQGKPGQKNMLYMTQLRKRGLQKPFEAFTKKAEKQLREEKHSSAENDYIRYRIADEANAFYGQRQLRQFDSSLQAKIKNLDAYYFKIRLRESCELLNRHQVLNTDYEPDFFDDWISQLEAGHPLLKKIPTLGIYVQVFRCYRFPDQPEIFKQFQSLLSTQSELFPPEEARALYRHAQNYCIRRINIGKLDYRKDLFTLYLQQLESGVIFDSGELDHSDFKNIVTVALRLKKFDWAMDFIEKYHPMISVQYRSNVYHFCKADMHYSMGQLREAIHLLKAVTFTDIFYQLSARTLLIKLYYEMEESEGLYYALEAFERFLRRNKSLAKSRREIYRGFINLCRRLVKLRERKPLLSKKEFSGRKAQFLLRVSEAGRLANSDWLEEKAEEV